MSLPPLDQNPPRWEKHQHLDRLLSRPALAGIGISGCVGAGIFVTSGILISTIGSLGAAISYVVAGSIVACVLYSVTEMVACRPVAGALIDFPHHFLDPAFGFAVAASYALANVCSMATLTAQSAELTALLKDNPSQHKVAVEAGINIGFIVLTTLTHSFGVYFYGKLERVVMWFKIALLVLVCVLMIVINAGGAGPRQGSYQTRVSDEHYGIGGSGGQLFAFLTAVSLAMFSCMGGEIVAMTAGEAHKPYSSVPVAMSFVYLVPLTIYPFAMISVGASINYADPHLAKPWAKGSGPMSQSPFVTAILYSSLHGLPKVLNVFFVISAYTAANTALYVASRTIFTLSQQYLPSGSKVAKWLGRTNDGNTPLAAIVLCSALGFLSLTGLSQYAYSQPRLTLSEFYTGSTACVYICLCFSFLNFKAGLDNIEEETVFVGGKEIYAIARGDPIYIKKLFKSRWQPLPAYYGIAGCALVIVWSGVPPIFILATKGSLTSTENLKSTTALAFDVIGAYLGPLLFLLFYLGYKKKTGCHAVDVRDLNPDHYILPNMEELEQSSHEETSVPQVPLSLDGHIELPVLDNHQQVGNHAPNADIPQAQQAQEIEHIGVQRVRDQIEEILRQRPTRWDGFWTVAWSFVAVSKEEKLAIREKRNPELRTVRERQEGAP